MRIYAFAALIALSAAGQQKAPQTANAGQGTLPMFHSSSNLVIVDVTVKDPKTGEPIEGLKASDFTILEDKKPQKISQFEFQKLSTEVAPPPPPPSLGDQHELPEDPKPQISVPARNEVQYHDKRLLVLFFDFSNMGVPEQLRAQESALKYIDKQMTPSDLMAIMLYTSTVQVKSDFTANRMQLEDIVKGLPIGEAAELADLADTGADDSEDTGAAFVADETEFNIFNTDRKLAAIEDAVKKLAALPEKKVLIYITGGITKTGVDNQAQLEASVNAAVKANVAIYPIDARGLMADPPGGGASKARRAGPAFSMAPCTTRNAPASTPRRKRWPPSPPIPAEKSFSIRTTFHSASCRRSANFAATTYLAITRPTTRWTASIAASRSS